MHPDSVDSGFPGLPPHPIRWWPAVALVTAALIGLIGLLYAAPTPVAAQATRWVPPLASIRVVAGFSPPAERWLAGHRGVDLLAAAGQTVRAAGAGTVSFAGIVADRGVVSVKHGELRTTYEPVQTSVVAGQTVAAGQVIGTIGPGGHCDSRCLHWGLLAGDTYLDPMLLLQNDPPILKPPGRARSSVTDSPLVVTDSRSTSTNQVRSPPIESTPVLPGSTEGTARGQISGSPVAEVKPSPNQPSPQWLLSALVVLLILAIVSGPALRRHLRPPARSPTRR